MGTLGGSAAGALIDTKMGKNGQAHKLFAKADGTGGFPTNIVIGAVLAVPAIAIKKMPLKGPIAATGLALAGVGLYRYIVDYAAATAAAPAPGDHATPNAPRPNPASPKQRQLE